MQGYHQVPVHLQDVPTTAVITPFGLFEFLRMPFGLKGVTQTFQRLMDSVLRDLLVAFVYLDDILVASTSADEHLFHLHQLFSRLHERGLIVNPAKCRFGLPAIDFLGHHVSPKMALPLPGKVEAVTAFPQPWKVEGLQEFLRMVNFYNHFMRLSGAGRPARRWTGQWKSCRLLQVPKQLSPMLPGWHTRGRPPLLPLPPTLGITL